jgi:hypothetical protein
LFVRNKTKFPNQFAIFGFNNVSVLVYYRSDPEKIIDIIFFIGLGMTIGDVAALVL